MRVIAYIPETAFEERAVALLEGELPSKDHEISYAIDVEDYHSMIANCDYDAAVVFIDSVSDVNPYKAIKNLPMAQLKAPIVAIYNRSPQFMLCEIYKAGIPFSMEMPSNDKADFNRGALLPLLEAASVKHANHNAQMEFGPFKINYSARTLSYNDTPLVLTAKQYEIIAFLAKNKGAFKTPEAILDHVDCNGRLQDANAVRVHISHMRQYFDDIQTLNGGSIETDGFAFKDIITTKRGLGYCFNPDIFKQTTPAIVSNGYTSRQPHELQSA